MRVLPEAPVDDRRQRPGHGLSWRGLLVLSVLALGLMLGCHSLNFLNRDRPGIKNDHDAGTSSQPTTPGKYSFRLAPCIFFSDFELKRDQPEFQELTNFRDQVYKDLQLEPGDAVVQVYLFEDRDRYEQYIKAKYPKLPRRRAFFVAQQRAIGGQDELLVYTFRGERMQQDLRHELTHALLHSVLKDVPLWLDEGLAEYFELPTANKGLNPIHVLHLRNDLSAGKKPNLARLESLREVSDMSPAEYREAWAWVHLMLNGQPETRKLLLSYLHSLRETSNPPLLGPKLAAVLPAPEEALVRHLAALEDAGSRQ